MLSGAAFATPPANDDFTNALFITGTSGISAVIDTTNATAEVGEPDHAERGAFHSVWWAYTAPTNGILIVDTLASDVDFDTTLGVYTGSALSNLTEVAFNDDVSSDDYRSRLSLEVSQGEMYRIAVDGYDEDETGSVVMNWTLGTTDNDDFTKAAVIVENSGTSDLIDTTFATAEPSEPAHAGQEPFHSVWWHITAPTNGALSLDTRESSESFDTVLGVYTGSSISNLTEITSNDDDPDQEYSHSRVVLEVVQGVSYWIAVDGYDGETGLAVLSWELVPLDGDGDGVRTIDEWIADTNPNNSNDWFHITGFDASTVFFESSANRIYTLYRCTNLVENYWNPATEGRHGIDGSDSLSATNEAPKGFFKVEVRMP